MPRFRWRPPEGSQLVLPDRTVQGVGIVYLYADGGESSEGGTLRTQWSASWAEPRRCRAAVKGRGPSSAWRWAGAELRRARRLESHPAYFHVRPLGCGFLPRPFPLADHAAGWIEGPECGN